MVVFMHLSTYIAIKILKKEGYQFGSRRTWEELEGSTMAGVGGNERSWVEESQWEE